jgi:hypothetical protein
MWDMIVDMATNRLWIYTGIGGSIFGAIAVAYLSTTRLGVWFYAKIDKGLDYLVKRWGLVWLQEPEDMWRKRNPVIADKIDELEKRISELEK